MKKDNQLNKLLFLLFIFIYIISNSQIKSGEIIYIKKNYIPNLNIEDKSQDYIDNLENLKIELKEVTKKLRYKLRFNVNESLFFLSNSVDTDDANFIMASTISGGKGVYYSNLDDKLLLHKNELGGNYFIIKKKTDSIDWKLTTETKRIGEYLCYKATTKEVSIGNVVTNKKVIAWYCPSIPFQFGPIDYCNLPGLILEINIEKGATFIATNIQLHNHKTKIKKPNKGKVVTLHEFEQIAKEMYNNLTDR